MEQLTRHIWRYQDDTQAASYLVTGRDRAYMIDCGTGCSPVMPACGPSPICPWRCC